jgi:hypothetical protein
MTPSRAAQFFAPPGFLIFEFPKIQALFPSPSQSFSHSAKLFEPRDTIESGVIHSCRDGAGYQLRAVFHSEVFHA